MSPKSLLVAITPFYIALGPVYWFFGLPPSVFNGAKYLLAMIIIGSTLIIGSFDWMRDKQFFRGSAIFLILAVIFLSIPGMFFNQSDQSIGTLSRYFILMGLLVSFYWLSSSETLRQRLPWVLCFVLLPLCGLTVLEWLGGLGLRTADGLHPLNATGFSTTRTGWSSGLACPAIFLVWRYLTSGDKYKMLFLLTAGVIMMSQLASGGRGGLLASLMGTLGVLVYYRRFSLLGVIGLLACLFVIAMQDTLIQHLRFDRLSDPSQGTDFTSGRAQQYGLAFALIKTPMDLLFGLGPKGYEAAFEDIGIHFEIHNVWLRLFVEYGIFLPVFVLFYFMRSIIGPAFNKLKDFAPSIVLGAGLITTLVEPNAILFSYQNYLLWWWLFICVKSNNNNKEQSFERFIPSKYAV